MWTPKVWSNHLMSVWRGAVASSHPSAIVDAAVVVIVRSEFIIWWKISSLPMKCYCAVGLDRCRCGLRHRIRPACLGSEMVGRVELNRRMVSLYEAARLSSWPVWTIVGDGGWKDVISRSCGGVIASSSEISLSPHNHHFPSRTGLSI